MEMPATLPGGAAEPPQAPPISERIKEASARASERETKRPRGRPQTPGSPHSQFKTPGVRLAPGEKSAGARTDPPFAPGVVERAVKALCSTLDRFVQRRTYHTALILTKEKQISEAFATEVAMEQEEKEQIASLSEIVCAQYSILGQQAPVVLLGTHVIGYGTKVFLVLNKLEEIAKFNLQKAPAPAPEAKAA